MGKRRSRIMRVVTGAVLLGLLVAVVASAQPPRGTNDPKQATPSKIAGKSLDEWKKELTIEDASRRAQAIVAIAQFGEAASSCVPAIVDRLTDKDVSPRARALGALRVIPV